MLRRLLPVLLFAAALAAPAGAAGAVRSSIFYYPWYGTPQPRRLVHPLAAERGRAAGPDRVVVLPCARPVLERRPARPRRRRWRRSAAPAIDQISVSWWGWGSVEDRRLELLLPEAADARASTSPRTSSRTAAAPRRRRPRTSRHLRELGIKDFYVYGPQDDTAENWAAARASLPADVRLFAQTHLVGWAAAGRFDGVYTYDVLVFTGDRFARLCEQARKAKLLCAPSVGPGYDARRAVADARVRPRRQGRTYDGMWASAIRAGADLVTITSYNEWHEGTQIEPARARRGYHGYDGAWGTRGRDAERAYLDRTAYWTARFSRGW